MGFPNREKFRVSSLESVTEEKQRTMEITINLYARPDEHLIVLLSNNQVNIATSYSISYPFCLC